MLNTYSQRLKNCIFRPKARKAQVQYVQDQGERAFAQYVQDQGVRALTQHVQDQGERAKQTVRTRLGEREGTRKKYRGHIETIAKISLLGSRFS